MYFYEGKRNGDLLVKSQDNDLPFQTKRNDVNIR